MKRLFCYSLTFAAAIGFASTTFAQFGGPVNGASVTGRNNLGQNPVSGVNGEAVAATTSVRTRSAGSTERV